MYVIPNLQPDELLVYLRKSRSDDPDLTIEEVLSKHESILEEWVTRIVTGGLRIPEENRYREVVSGETIKDRPIMRSLLRIIENPRIKAVCVVEPQRLSRGDLEDAGKIINSFRYSNTYVFTPTFSYDLSDERDRDMFERELKRGNEFLEYTKMILNRGRTLAVNHGRFIGNTSPYGYDKDVIIDGRQRIHTLKPNPTEAPIVRLIFELYNQGYGIQRIANHLNDIKAPTRTGKAWNPHSIRDMLYNEHYIGNVRWGRRRWVKHMEEGKVVASRPKQKEYLTCKGLHEPIVSEDVFRAAQARQSTNPPSPATKKLANPLAGLLFCESCGRAITRRQFHNKNGKIKARPRYLCSNSMICGNGSIAVDDMLEQVKNIMRDNISDFEMRISAGKDNSDLRRQEAITRLEDRISQLDKREIQIWEDRYNEVIPVHVFKVLDENLKTERKEAQLALDKLKESESDINAIEAQLTTFHAALDLLNDPDAPVEQQNYLLKQCFARIEFWKNRDMSRRKSSDVTDTRSSSLRATLRV